MKDVDVVVCGADSLTVHGFVNKVGSTMLALLCKQHDTPLLVLSDTMKCTPGSINDIIYDLHVGSNRTTQLEEKDGREITDSWCQAGILPTSACSESQMPAKKLRVRNIYFEETPYNICGCTIITEKGMLDQESLKAIICKLSDEYRKAFLNT
jgi:translation initiation factor 2B subunit (eIF-2B alpha/beta/delta family)